MRGSKTVTKVVGRRAVTEVVPVWLRPERPTKAVLLLDPELHYWKCLAAANWADEGYTQIDYKQTIAEIGSRAFEANFSQIMRRRWLIIKLFKQFVGSRTSLFQKCRNTAPIKKKDISAEVKLSFFGEHKADVIAQLPQFLAESKYQALLRPIAETEFGKPWVENFQRACSTVIHNLIAKQAKEVIYNERIQEVRANYAILMTVAPYLRIITDSVLVIKSADFDKLHRRKMDKVLIPDTILWKLYQGKISRCIMNIRSFLLEHFTRKVDLDSVYCPALHLSGDRLYSQLSDLVNSPTPTELIRYAHLDTGIPSQREIDLMEMAWKESGVPQEGALTGSLTMASGGPQSRTSETKKSAKAPQGK
jgi:hypothetical protein